MVTLRHDWRGALCVSLCGSVEVSSHQEHLEADGKSGRFVAAWLLSGVQTSIYLSELATRTGWSVCCVTEIFLLLESVFPTQSIIAHRPSYSCLPRGYVTIHYPLFYNWYDWAHFCAAPAGAANATSSGSGGSSGSSRSHSCQISEPQISIVPGLSCLG